MRQRLKSDFRVTSSFLLHQIVQRSQDLEAEEEFNEEEVEGEDHLESEESSVSEMQELEEFDGVLREEVIANALHQLGRSGSGTEQVYLNLTLSDCDLIDVSILSGYVHLQKLDLSVNKIKDLSCVSFMPYLLELNASRNKLTTFFNFYPPKNLQKVDFSFNQISAMSDLSAYQALTKLILDSNEIEEIVGLQHCNSLTHLSLSKNKITTISGLDALPIRTLCLSCNKIEKITGLDELRTLQILDLSHNQISSLQGLENHEFLEMINLEDNKIAELGELEYIEHLPLLRVLNFLKNPIQEKTDYWFFIIFMLPRLIELDQKKINVEDKVAAVNKYDPPPELVAAQDHLTHVANSVMQPQRIFDSTLPSLDAPYPMLILVGPEACGKRELAHRLCRQYSKYFRYGACHTTRPPYFGEGDRVDYHFISQEDFDEMRNMGKFILTFNYGNHNYGLNRDTVEGIARDGLASCIHMEIEGVRSLKCSYFEPRYILVVPMNKTKYEGYLRRKGLFSRIEIEFAVSRVDLYVQINQTLPGYFDAVINADDLDIAYQNLSQLIREYLGLSDHSAMTLAPTDIDTTFLETSAVCQKSFEFLDSTDRNYYVKLWARFSDNKSPVEKESLARQYQTVRTALMGRIPLNRIRLFQRGSIQIPAINDLRYLTHLEPKKSYDSSEGSFETFFKDEKIDKDYLRYPFIQIRASSLQSSIHKGGSPLSRPPSAVKETTESFTSKELHKQAMASRKKSPPLGRQRTFSQKTSSFISLEGSNTKPTLPPIPQGRKWMSA